MADFLFRYVGSTFGWATLAAFLVGVTTLGRARRWAELTLLAGPVVVFAGYFATRSVFFERNLSHVAPLFLIGAAFGAITVADGVAHRLRLAGRRAWTATALMAALLVLRPLGLTGLLVGIEFSGRGDQRHAAVETAIRAQYPDAGWLSTLFLTDEPFAEIAAHFQGQTKPLLVRVSDYHDEFTRERLRRFAERFEVVAVADDEGTFPDLPPCTLLTYHRSRERYFLVRGRGNH